MKDLIRLASRKDINLIQQYIRLNWSENHIFTKNKDLFFWQHRYLNDEELNFVIAINKDDQVCGLMGFISSNFTIFNKCVWTAIWHVDKKLCYSKNTGIKLLNFITETFKPHVISGTQLNKDVVNIYRFLGYTITSSEHFFLPAAKKSNIFETRKQLKIGRKDNTNNLSLNINNDFLEEIKLAKNMINKKELNNYNYTESHKDEEYLLHRYNYHPKYKYSILKIKEDNNILCQLIIRQINIGNKKLLRIVDIIYLNLSINCETYSRNITNFLVDNQYEYIDFVSAANSCELAKSMGFYKRNDDDIIPNHFEPFQKKNVDTIIAYKLSNEKNYFFFKGDADSDRPNV